MNHVFRDNLIGETIFNNKYRHEGCETWEQLSRTMVADVQRDVTSRSEQRECEAAHAAMKFIAGGRYLYYAGRPIKAFNNCLSGDTNVLTDEGMRRLDSFDEGEKVFVYSPVSKQFELATMHYRGEQPLTEIVFENIRGKSKRQWRVKATPNHKWPTGRGDVEDIRVGDVVGAAVVELSLHESAWVHGFVFGDGGHSSDRVKNHFAHQLRLCGHKVKHLDFLTAMGHGVTYPPSANGEPVLYVKSHRNLKLLPNPDVDSNAYIASFIKGWLAADGFVGATNQIHSIHKDAIEFFDRYAHLAGFVTTGDLKCQEGPTNFSPNGRKPLWRVNFKSAEDFQGFKVVEIRDLGVHPVYCPFEPKYNRITIDHGIDTFQCYLLRADEDTREDWAELSWKAERCLSTGGGIGIDYSVYREHGAPLKRTGGFASGPLSKARMINEIGREVMQGGSRRSAIYGSLNWQHPDAGRWLKAKNWDQMRIPGTDATLADAKLVDFNWPAPLDMTNISLNYDDAWLGDRMNPTFIENCRQALRTGEPGFSFNFGARQRETLRNACNEVTSEDDSDVCNLASINMARADSLEDFKNTVYHASRFLLCGTLFAHLPYDKVYEVRAKNRRLGLGLMGVHEWLVQRGYRYEMNDELRRWLAAYRDVSTDAALELANHLGISAPVAFRAIAPTGTIGMLAGTTTGIEPVYAVAYKRRYLKSGTNWVYQYVVDGAAKRLIDMYGVSPDKVESAIDLASDWERRIAFQAEVQSYVDMGISSTINLPEWGSDLNNEDRVQDFAKTLANYAPRLRGFTAYPNGARGGQPLTAVPYNEAVGREGEEYLEEQHDVCSITNRGGSCGV